MNTPSYPQVTYVFPSDLDPATNLTPQLIIDWSTDINEQEFQGSNLVKNVKVYNTDTGANVSLTFNTYEINKRRIILNFASALAPNTRYTVLINKGVKDKNRRSLQLSRNWTFTTIASAVNTPVIIQPAAYSTVSSLSFQFTPVAGEEVVFEISSTPSFSNILFTGSSTTSPFTPVFTFTEGSTYYWRAKSRNTTTLLESSWSETRSFLFSTAVAAPVITNTVLTIIEHGFDQENSNLLTWPEISLTFNQPIDIATLTTAAKLTKEGVLGRLDQPNSLYPQIVNGTWSLSGSKYVFTPTGNIEDNTKYLLKIDNKVLASSGISLDREYELIFFGKFTPFFANRFEVETILGNKTKHLPKGLIDFNIHRASLDAQVRIIGAQGSVLDAWNLIIAPPSESLVRSQNPSGYLVVRWVAHTAVVYLLKRILINEIDNVGRTFKLADYSESLDKDFIDGLKELIRDVENEISRLESLILGSSVDYGERHNKSSIQQKFSDLSIGSIYRGLDKY